jgi:peptidoglycan/LPS O-acetylase OafA/YrhL
MSGSNDRAATRRSYVAGLDGLRAVAVGTVFLYHATAQFRNAVGVDMFFALSGFLITRGLLEQLEKHDRIDLRLFYIRRALRLLPALLAMIASLLVFAAAMGVHPLRVHVIASFTSLTYMMNWSRAFGWSSSGWLGHTWSLSIEEQFYLAWPLILSAVYARGGLKYALLCALFLAGLSVLVRIHLLHAGAAEDRLYNGFDTRGDGLLIGCALALARLPRLAAWAGRLWLVPALTIGLIFLFVPWIALQTLTFTLLAGATAWLILACWYETSPGLVWLLELLPVRYVGRISYGLYLWHWPILNILWEHHFKNGVGMAALAAGLTLLCAALSFHFVEQPLLRLKEMIGHTVTGATRRTEVAPVHGFADQASRLPERGPS